jgi:hypothetical protein
MSDPSTQELKSMADEAVAIFKEYHASVRPDPFRDFPDATKPPDPPRARTRDIELLSQTIAIRVWAFRTTHDLATVLRPDFFGDLRDVHMKKNDRIETIASWDEPEAEHATLCVDHVSKSGGDIRVSLLCKYERAA